jgi:hypothetical protein
MRPVGGRAQLQTALAGQRVQELVHERRLPDARRPRDEQELRLPARRHPFEGVEQRGALVVPAVELLRRLRSLQRLPLAEGERVDAPV